MYKEEQEDEKHSELPASQAEKAGRDRSNENPWGKFEMFCAKCENETEEIQLMKARVEKYYSYAKDLESEKPKWLATDESPVEGEKHSGHDRVKTFFVKPHLLGQDIYTPGFVAAAHKIRDQREQGKKLTLVGTSCWGNLALLKNLVKLGDPIPQLIVLDVNSAVENFWKMAKVYCEPGDDDEYTDLFGGLAEMAENVFRDCVEDKELDGQMFIQVMNNETGDEAKLQTACNLTFQLNDSFESEKKLEEFYAAVIKNAVFIPVNHNDICCEQIFFTNSKITQVGTKDVVFYGSNICDFLGDGSAMAAWVMGLDAKWVVASNKLPGESAPTFCDSAQRPEGGWTPQELISALSPVAKQGHGQENQ